MGNHPIKNNIQKLLRAIPRGKNRCFGSTAIFEAEVSSANGTFDIANVRNSGANHSTLSG
jgi:hypothetical protein